MGITQQLGASSIIKPGVIDNTAARPASPYEGQVIFQKDTDQLLVWNGTTWISVASASSWQTWTPTVTAQTGAFTTVTVDTARYQQIGKIVNVQIVFTITSIGTGGGIPIFTLPVTASAVAFLAMGTYREIANTGLIGIISQESTTTGAMRRYDNAASVAAGNKFAGSFFYEAA
jgi:hypothetical protein